MAANTFTQWQSDGLGLNMGPQPTFRNTKDHLLSGYKTSVEAEYPDGYLGTLPGNRRADKVLGEINRMNARSYQRGVHKGERINPTDYLWPAPEPGNPMGFDKFTGLRHQEAGMRYAPPGQEPVRLVNEGKVPISKGIERQPKPVPAMGNPERQAKLKSLAPRWR